MKKCYLLIYSNDVGGRENVRDWLNSNDEILHWRTDLPNMFYIVSEEDSSSLSQSFVSYIGKKRHLIVEVGENRQGVLPPESWYLMRNKKKKPKE